MYNLVQFIKESTEKDNNVVNNFELILNNLRRDRSEYIGAIAKIIRDWKIYSVINKEVWGEYNAPINKTFERGDKSLVKFNKDDMVVLVWDLLDNGENELKNLFICKYKDTWYYQNRGQADNFMKNVEIIKIDEP